MTVSTMFTDFLGELRIGNAEQINLRYGEITAALNKKFRDTESKTANTLQVGSYGRWTAIKGISDLDMLYIMPKGKWQDYKDGKQSKLLADTKAVILERYPTTTVIVDQLVVTVKYQNFDIEVQPVFENDDGSFQYPYTYNGGSWKPTKPREEIKAMKEFVDQKNKNLRRLCKMARAWKDKHGVVMGGLLIDTLAYNFLKSTTTYDGKGFSSYGEMSRDFFEFLKDQPDQDNYKALGSNQNVKVKKKFQRKAKKAYNLCVKAVAAGDKDSAYNKWKKVYGRQFPAKPAKVVESDVTKSLAVWKNTEQFVEDIYTTSYQYQLEIDCDVYHKTSPKRSLSVMLDNGHKISSNRKLVFKIVSNDIPYSHEIKWKVLNQGSEARRKDCIRGDLIDSNEPQNKRSETADFRGNHLVECYAILNGVVVAMDSIEVPIL
jgi:hypothetical protein